MGALKFIRGVYGGVKEYGQQRMAANMEAERNLSGTFGGSSTEADVMRVAAETDRIKKERGVSLRSSLRRHLKMTE